MSIDLGLDRIVPETKYTSDDGMAFTSHEECAKYQIVQKIYEYIENVYAREIGYSSWDYNSQIITINNLLNDRDLVLALAEFHKFTAGEVERKAPHTGLEGLLTAVTPEWEPPLSGTALIDPNEEIPF